MQGETRFEVRYAETDQMGIVHHSNYAVWFEAARTALFQQQGTSYADIEKAGAMLPLYELQCRYIAPALFGDTVVVEARVNQMTRTRMVFDYAVRRAADGTLLATGSTAHAWTNRDLRPANAARLIPDIYTRLAEAIQAHAAPAP